MVLQLITSPTKKEIRRLKMWKRLIKSRCPTRRKSKKKNKEETPKFREETVKTQRLQTKERTSKEDKR